MNFITRYVYPYELGLPDENILLDNVSHPFNILDRIGLSEMPIVGSVCYVAMSNVEKRFNIAARSFAALFANAPHCIWRVFYRTDSPVMVAELTYDNLYSVYNPSEDKPRIVRGYTAAVDEVFKYKQEVPTDGHNSSV